MFIQFSVSFHCLFSQEFDQMKNDGRRGTIDSKEFIDMFKEVATRPEVYFLLIR